MRMPNRCLLLAALVCLPVAAAPAQPPKAAVAPVVAVVETSLKTAGGQIRQFAFDGDANSYFHSAGNPAGTDHFTLTLDKAVSVKSITVTTGKPKGGDALDAGILEGSEDGKKFEELAKFADGTANAKLQGKKLKVIRLKSTEAMKHPLAIREIKI